ncbi:MAG: hypothetical protein IJ675_08895 [Pseudobutyrivibrio sp.]|nr:hypothetical protein [Pseudobutyrivibrio sp.]
MTAIVLIWIVMFIRSKSSDILLFKHRFKARHAKPAKTGMTIIRDNSKKRRKRR